MVSVDADIFNDLSNDELKDTIVKNVREIKRLQSDLKEYRGGVNETIKELDARNEAALDQIDKNSGTAQFASVQ